MSKLNIYNLFIFYLKIKNGFLGQILFIKNKNPLELETRNPPP
tara:strand:+ start:246 stop:374 length:129 start_codon:yes stop_codon:yes gene_type:complete